MGTLKTRLCRYRYDALDQMTVREPAGQETLQQFYRREHLTTERQGQASQSVFQQGTQLLALQFRDGDVLNSQLLATDPQRSVLQVINSGGTVWQVYTPYGHRRVESGFGSLLGFNGEADDPVTGHYLLGNGHRAFNPALMRFNTPDSLSPFGRGGLNSYAYCLGDPVNFSDPTGRFAAIARIISSAGNLSNSVITLRPGIPFQVAEEALANGALYRLPLSHTAGAVSSVVAGTMGAVGGVIGLGSAIVAAINPASVLLAPLAYSTLGATAITVAGRAGSYWAARNPAILPALKKLAEGSSAAVSPAASSASRRSSSIAIDMGSAPSAPPFPPGTPQPSAPIQTPGYVGGDHFYFNSNSGPSDLPASATSIRRRKSL